MYYTVFVKNIFTIIVLVLSGVGCAPVIGYHGNDAPERKVASLRSGISDIKKVQKTLGSPNYVALDGNRLWLYMSRITTSWLPTFETEASRRVVGIYFNKNGVMIGKKVWTAANMQNISFVPNTTPSPIPELNWVQRLFSNIGRVTPAGIPQQQGP